MSARTAMDANLILARFEVREPQLTGAASADRAAGLEFGWELNRLQGAVKSDIDRRLAELYNSGRVTKQEYVALVCELARVEQLVAVPA